MNHRGWLLAQDSNKLQQNEIFEISFSMFIWSNGVAHDTNIEDRTTVMQLMVFDKKKEISYSPNRWSHWHRRFVSSSFAFVCRWPSACPLIAISCSAIVMSSSMSAAAYSWSSASPSDDPVSAQAAFSRVPSTNPCYHRPAYFEPKWTSKINSRKRDTESFATVTLSLYLDG